MPDEKESRLIFTGVVDKSPQCAVSFDVGLLLRPPTPKALYGARNVLTS